MTTTHPPSSTRVFGDMKLSQDLSKLVNSRKGSDIRFLVGPGPMPDAKTCDDSQPVCMYGHSVILRCRSRYFDVMFEDDKQWKEKSSGVIHKPNVSPIVFQALLYYIYTGGVDLVDR